MLKNSVRVVFIDYCIEILLIKHYRNIYKGISIDIPEMVKKRLSWEKKGRNEGEEMK